jgi:hypothetical protein
MSEAVFGLVGVDIGSPLNWFLEIHRIEAGAIQPRIARRCRQLNIVDVTRFELAMNAYSTPQLRRRNHGWLQRPQAFALPASGCIGCTWAVSS